MATLPDDIHSKAVDLWFQKSAKKLSPLEKIQILEKAIKTIELRACETLSNVTLMIVLDRILHHTKEKFPVLSKANIETNSLSFKSVDKEPRPDDISEALIFLLAEMLRVLGRLTANILTIPLHKELMKVKLNDSEES